MFSTMKEKEESGVAWATGRRLGGNRPKTAIGGAVGAVIAEELTLDWNLNHNKDGDMVISGNGIGPGVGGGRHSK